MNNFQKLNFDNIAVKNNKIWAADFVTAVKDAKVRQCFTFKNILFTNEGQESCDEPQQAKLLITKIYQDTKFVFNFISIDYMILNRCKLECWSE